MNASGLYPGYTFWNLTILDSQGWFRPDYLSQLGRSWCQPRTLRRAFIGYIHRLVSIPAWSSRLDWYLPEVPSSPNYPVILWKVGPSSWISPLRADSRWELGMSWRHQEGKGIGVTWCQPYTTRQQGCSGSDCCYWLQKGHEMTALHGLKGSLGPWVQCCAHICIVQTWGQIPFVLLRLLSL